MKEENLFLDESETANNLRNEILRNFQNEVQPKIDEVEQNDFEMISQTQKPYVSPIFTIIFPTR